MSSRRRPLHTGGVAILSIAHMAHTRSKDFSGPIGSLARKLTRLVEFAGPVVYALQYQLLVTLSFGDDLILAIEKRVETIFPPSKHVFNTTDKLIEITETLPQKFDDAIKEFPMIIHQYSLLDWAVNLVISWLNYWISMLMHWEFEHAKEKEIRVDTHTNQPVESSRPSTAQSSKSDIDNVNVTDKQEVTYKEALLEKRKKESMAKNENGLENGGPKRIGSKDGEEETNENIANKDDGKMQETQKQDVCEDEDHRNVEEVGTSKTDENISKRDQILELFESGWLMTPQKE
ncbi:hypothetical protein CISIN_1g037269mg, partial [Citrus sinensis]